MDSKFGRNMKAPSFHLEQGAELECWNRFIRRFDIAIIGAGLKIQTEKEGATTRRGKAKAEKGGESFQLEQKKAALLLDGMGEIGMDIFESWNIEIDQMQYEDLKKTFEEYFSEKENIIATRHRFFTLEQNIDEETDKFIERVERAGKICKFGGLLNDMVVQIIIKGMTNEKVRRELLGKKELDVYKVKSVCNRFEAAVNASKVIAKGQSSQQEVDRVGIDSQQEKMTEINRLDHSRGNYRGRSDRGYRSGFGRGRGCYTCGNLGHMSRDCWRNSQAKKEYDSRRMQRGCFTCGGPHLARECTKEMDKNRSTYGRNQVKQIGGASDSEESL